MSRLICLLGEASLPLCGWWDPEAVETKAWSNSEEQQSDLVRKLDLWTSTGAAPLV